MICDDKAAEAAARLCAAAGRAPAARLHPLAGGKNNRVFRVDLRSGESLALKIYHRDERDPRDRLGAEWAFLDYAWRRGVRALPEPIAQDRGVYSGLYAFVHGRKLAPGEVASAHLDQAAEFVLAVNAPPREPMVFAPASEACFSLDAHLATVERRVEQLWTLDPDAPQKAETEALVRERLTPLWREVRARIEAGAASCGTGHALPAAEVIVSPSDFGFHNALVDNTGRVSFLDFEYAGRDDPAKLVCDLFCCPQTPAPLALRQSFAERLERGLKLGPAFRARCDTLLDAYRIKWTCILLNEFLPVAATRRAFALPGERAARCAAQLAKAEIKLAEIGMR